MENICFVCNRGEAKDPFLKCNVRKCTKVYHKNCLKQFPYVNEYSGMNW